MQRICPLSFFISPLSETLYLCKLNERIGSSCPDRFSLRSKVGWLCNIRGLRDSRPRVAAAKLTQSGIGLHSSRLCCIYDHACARTISTSSCNSHKHRNCKKKGIDVARDEHTRAGTLEIKFPTSTETREDRCQRERSRKDSLGLSLSHGAGIVRVCSLQSQPIREHGHSRPKIFHPCNHSLTSQPASTPVVQSSTPFTDPGLSLEEGTRTQSRIIDVGDSTPLFLKSSHRLHLLSKVGSQSAASPQPIVELQPAC